ncbi:winged helix-turn-helix domain-containing protein [Rathayibacter toxicus]|uniref:ArsR family transcriptional regulator n=1 Tax=Rathayibacter toxicus TaxID=145458 RepID=A0A2S5Y9S3_9MICO|nr:winged helix-turn-helix domain-containing protein [Rathayibacter toxicus]PPH25457.1 ArsR family transcriptional regulator [Rathayibacter toxicus]PPH59160.1 ArsR family transcriptional regulator [Rathayibacter toxicus]PPH61269.1 ArsR family transcriptional regulator [Rathayibacter toxicus]PPH89236.1 ArsR family transcriptional regulator [Rathayibacter toxicus]PPI17062.1 ArsR family transcriptional regulator [Rathayibacter toxicus]
MTSAEKEIVRELDDIRERLARLEAAMRTQTPLPSHHPSIRDDPFWALSALKERLSPHGGVVFAGAVNSPAGPIEWQYGLTADVLVERDWGANPGPTALAALGSSVRLRFVQAIANGKETVAQLAESEGAGTTGQIYHHINQLVAAGWLETRGRGRYGIPPERLVPLLVILLAAGGPR